jgi:outer membrane protein assembly factor BamB
MKCNLSIILPLLLIAQSVQAGDDWTQYQGPDRGGISQERSLARSWPEEGPKTLWSIDVGLGYGGASVREKKVYLLDRQEDQRDVLRCLDLETGKELWQCANETPGRLSHNGSRSVPTLDDQRVYAVGPFGHVYCVDQKSHKFLWTLDMTADFQASSPKFGFSQSPLLLDDMVIVAPMSDQAGLVALNKITGKVVWKSQPIGSGSYASAIIANVAGVKGILFLAKDQLFFLEPKTGKLIWKYNGYPCRNPIPFPTVIGNERIFLTGGYKAGSVMIQVSKKDQTYNFSEVFRLEERGSKIQPALFYKGHLYANFGKLACFDPDGKPKWASGDFVEGNLIIADEMIYILNSSTGQLSLVELNDQSYKELSQAKVLEGNDGEMYGPIALSHGKLILRDQHQMKCLDIRAK